MSIETIYYPKSATKEQLCEHLGLFGFEKDERVSLWLQWPDDSCHFYWFDDEDFRSSTGVTAVVYPASDEEKQAHGPSDWVLYARTRGSSSTFDRTQQNEVIRAARRKFGGHFVNDWYGRNRYTPIEPDNRGPSGRGIWLTYSYVEKDLSMLRFSLPEPKTDLSALPGEIGEIMGQYEPVRVLYNALVPFLVSALEHFFSQTFRILLRYDNDAQDRLKDQNKKIEIRDAIAIREGTRTLEDVVAAWYSFQNLASINNAFKDWFNVDLWKLLHRRKKVGRRLPILEKAMSELIEFRHGVIHRFELDYGLNKEQFEELLDLALTVMDVLVDYLEQERGLAIRLE